jgi:hypothetical protein
MDYPNRKPNPDDDLEHMMTDDSTPQDRTRQLYCLLALVFFGGLAIGIVIVGRML